MTKDQTAQPIKDDKTLKKVMDYFDYATKNRLLIAYGLNSGLRISDMLQLRVSDVKKGFWLGNEKKTSKRRRVSFNSYLQNELNSYILKENLADNEYIFYGISKDKAMSRVAAHKILKKVADGLGLEHFSAHSLRKTFGYRWYYIECKDIAFLMDTFNHSSIQMTLKYIGLDDEQRDNAYKSIAIGY